MHPCTIKPFLPFLPFLPSFYLDVTQVKLCTRLSPVFRTVFIVAGERLGNEINDVQFWKLSTFPLSPLTFTIETLGHKNKIIVLQEKNAVDEATTGVCKPCCRM